MSERFIERITACIAADPELVRRTKEVDVGGATDVSELSALAVPPLDLGNDDSGDDRQTRDERSPDGGPEIGDLSGGPTRTRHTEPAQDGKWMTTCRQPFTTAPAKTITPALKNQRAASLRIMSPFPRKRMSGEMSTS
ncbi:hypothetical protein [Microbacterium sp. NPDC056057]|uniref:hypothetical protein n=1 Tax=Microbacterium sp. NPDC056057 TaxID=3345699 RepID=UPI0035DF52B3